MSELYVPIDGVGDSDLLSTYSSLPGGNATKPNMPWRPRSAPKNMSRTPSPFLGFLNKKGNHHQQDDLVLRKARDMDTDSTEKMYGAEGAPTGFHASYHDITLPARSALGTPNSSKESTSGSENGGPPPLTREEFEALPLAIQRKVREFLDLDPVSGVSLFPFLARSGTWDVGEFQLSFNFRTKPFRHVSFPHPTAPASGGDISPAV